MAPRDFAELPGPAPGPRGGPNWRAMFVVAAGLALVAASFVVGYSLGEKRGRMLAEHAGKQRLLDEIARQKNELARLKKKAEERKGAEPAATEVGELTFYNDLPRQKVAPAPLAEAGQGATGASNGANAGAPAGREHRHEPDVGRIIRQAMTQSSSQPTAGRPESGGGWRVQVGSYQRREDAEALAARARGKGFPATVEQAMVPDLGMWFRVYVGPYADRGAARAAQVRVQEAMHISGLLLRVRK